MRNLSKKVVDNKAALRSIGVALTVFGGLSMGGCGIRQTAKVGLEEPSAVPTWNRVKNAAIHAVTDPITLGSAAASAAVFASGTDEAISEWATTHHPVFGSKQGARDWSDWLRAGTIYSYYAGLSGEIAKEVAQNGTSGLLTTGLAGGAVGGVAAGANSYLTSKLKGGTGRLRPDGTDTRSFPSGHSSTASVHATLASRSIGRLGLPAPLTVGLNSGLGLMAAGTAWARVEGECHYLSDVLAGAALGHFFGTFVSDLFLGVGSPARINIRLDPSKENRTVGAGVSVPLSFLN
ncbi:MAG: phosphatase PAP2 family protein [Chitinivibrionales bacterium]|nr:phosphatase PAP2 family protein [Chitinivibrionales bacterium]MBD3358876.1 phosphatase PAP2 family protein [Chitinivibrionales bacterium]